MRNFKLLILTCDQSTLKWKSLESKLKVIKLVLNTIPNTSWEVDIRYQDFTPKVTNGRIDHTWYNAISYPIFREDYQFVHLHIPKKKWTEWKLQNTLRGANQVDKDFVGESYSWADEDTKRGKGSFNQFIQVVLHELWHELCRSTGIKDELHTWHTDKNDISKANWSIFNMANWQPTYQAGMKEVSRLQALINNLKTAFKRPEAVLPLVQRQADKILAEMAAIGHPMRITEGFRSIERQNALYAQGRTTKGSIVTNAKGGESFHNYGNAIDCVFINEGYNAPEQLWQVFGLVGKKHGFEWGGDWTNFKDRPHLEMKLGYTLKDYQQGKVDYSAFN